MKSIKKRFKFACWSCTREYTLFKEITEEQQLIVACPYCGKEAIAKLDPFKKDKKAVLKDTLGEDQSIGYEYDFPEVIPTQKPE